MNEEELEVQDLTEEEGEETTGGVAGYGNIQFVCQCKQSFINEYQLLNHLRKRSCTYADMYEQKRKGKYSAGKHIGKVKVKRTKKNIQLNYPNGAYTNALK